MNQIVLREDGYVSPCCHFGVFAWKELQELVGDKFEQLHISNGSLDEINRSEAMKIIEDSIYSDNPMPRCVQVCSNDNPDALTKKFTNTNVPVRSIRLR
jgi:hypothetical protein